VERNDVPFVGQRSTQIEDHLIRRLVFVSPLSFRISNSSSVIDLELLRVALIVAAAPEFEAALDRFSLHRLPHF
jgi:hypothetical protein